MWKEVIAVSFIGLFVTGCAFTPSQLNINPARYNGLTVIVRGYVELSRGKGVLYDSQTLFLELERQPESGSSVFDPRKHEKYCVTISNTELLYKNTAIFNAKTITFKGKFINSNIEGNAVDLGACPFSTSLVVDNADLTRRYQLLPSQR